MDRGRGQFRPCAGEKGTAKTDSCPADRRQPGSQRRPLVDEKGLPLTFTLTGGNRNDLTQLIPVLERVPGVKSQCGRPRPPRDRAQFRPRVLPWVVKRTLVWLPQFRCLLVRHERRAERHEAFLGLACCLICWRRLRTCSNGNELLLSHRPLPSDVPRRPPQLPAQSRTPPYGRPAPAAPRPRPCIPCTAGK